MQFTNYQKAAHYLIHDIPKTSRHVFDDSSTIEKNKKLMTLMGDPQNAHKTIHVAGTSGKGTVCYLIDSLLRAHTKRTGMSQSPHVYDIRERIQLNGQLISEKKFVQLLNTVIQKTSESDIQPSYFETLTAMGYMAFAHAPLDYMVIETGFGGRLDATNVITRQDKVCVITRIGLDHTDALGDTIEKIAREKAGIIQKNNHVIVLRQEPEVNAVFETRAKDMNATIEWVNMDSNYQKTNDLLATTVCRYLAARDGWLFDATTATSVLQQAFIPGRFEKRSLKEQLVILDGAHNPQKLAALTSRVLHEQKYPATIVFSVGGLKDITACLKTLQPIAKRIIATEYFTHQQDIPVRPLPASVIADHCKELGIDVVTSETPLTALNQATIHPEPIIVTGSFYLISEADKAFS